MTMLLPMQTCPECGAYPCERTTHLNGAPGVKFNAEAIREAAQQELIDAVIAAPPGEFAHLAAFQEAWKRHAAAEPSEALREHQVAALGTLYLLARESFSGRDVWVEHAMKMLGLGVYALRQPAAPASEGDYTTMSPGKLTDALGMDGRLWAAAFEQHFPHCGVGGGTLLAWFCNAIMAGYDHARGNPPLNGDQAELRAASAPEGGER